MQNEHFFQKLLHHNISSVPNIQTVTFLGSPICLVLNENLNKFVILLDIYGAFNFMDYNLNFQDSRNRFIFQKLRINSFCAYTILSLLLDKTKILAEGFKFLNSVFAVGKPEQTKARTHCFIPQNIPQI